MYTVAHIGGIFLFYPNLWNYFKNNLKIIDLDNSIHSQILLNNNKAWAHSGFVMLGTGVKCNKLLKIYCILFFIFLFMESAPYSSPRCVQSWFSNKAMAS